ncbi:MAG: hypothetical protein ABIH11_08655 [Candidatus Altiarchaeota archaeon]
MALDKPKIASILLLMASIGVLIGSTEYYSSELDNAEDHEVFKHQVPSWNPLPQSIRVTVDSDKKVEAVLMEEYSGEEVVRSGSSVFMSNTAYPGDVWILKISNQGEAKTHVMARILDYTYLTAGVIMLFTSIILYLIANR